MTKTQRLFKLLQHFRTLSPPVRAEDLAHLLEISIRSVYRDIDSLRAMGAIIDGEAGFGYRLIEDPALPPMMFSRLEMEALVLGLQEVRQVGDKALAQAANDALGKLRACLPKHMHDQMEHAALDAKRFRPAPLIQIDVDVLRQAIWTETAATISYQDANKQTSTRGIYPLSIVYMDNSPALMAWCQLREDYRVFRLDRMLSLDLTDENFRPKRAPMLREFKNRLQEEALVASKRLT